jgi:hypothetical protein
MGLARLHSAVAISPVRKDAPIAFVHVPIQGTFSTYQRGEGRGSRKLRPPQAAKVFAEPEYDRLKPVQRSSSPPFTEHGTLMAANVLNSERAIQANVEIVRAFVRLRFMLASNAELSRLNELESK